MTDRQLYLGIVFVLAVLLTCRFLSLLIIFCLLWAYLTARGELSGD